MENHQITLEDKKRITISQVKDIEAFDEDAILVNLAEEGIIIKGEKLNVEKLDLNEGILVAIGKVTAISYTGKKHKKAEKGNIIEIIKNKVARNR